MCLCTSEALLSFKQLHSKEKTLYTTVSQISCISGSVIALDELASRTFRTNVGYSMSFKEVNPMPGINVSRLSFSRITNPGLRLLSPRVVAREARV